MTQPTVFLAFCDDEKIVSAVAFGEPYGNHPGEVLETVDFLEDGMPDWRGGGICDERGAGPIAFQALCQALICAEQNAEIIGYEMRRVPMDFSTHDAEATES
jgi:hypothetical protein